MYENLIKYHFKECNQMMFLPGPRQAGKTTISQQIQSNTKNYAYLNWDKDKDKQLILSGTDKIAEHFKITILQKHATYIVFDEIHKYPNWKNFLKGFYDTYKNETKIIVTGSSKLDIYRKNADSLMGRYFIYRVHPLSVAEILHQDVLLTEIRQPKIIKKDVYKDLLQHGGFPEPFLKHSPTFSTRWNRTRHQLLFREDIRDLTNLQEISQIELLANFLSQFTSQLLNMSTLATKVQTTTKTIDRWISTLEQFYYCFRIRPWAKNITRTLVKQPKLYLWNWASIKDPGAKAENFIASHLLKAVHFWQDIGLGQYELFFIRDKEKREVDFLVCKDHQPWFLVEVKSGTNHSLSKGLVHFHKELGTKHAFQVCIDLPYVDIDCFSKTNPIIVPAQTFLSQLI